MDTQTKVLIILALIAAIFWVGFGFYLCYPPKYIAMKRAEKAREKRLQ